MAGIDIDKLAYRVKKRLDEVLPEGDDTSEEWKQRRESFAYALSKMRAIAGALQWRIPLKTIQAYAQELNGIQPMVADDKHLMLLIKVQAELCRYMLDRRRNIPPQALMLLLKGFTTMQRLALDPGRTVARRQELVAPIVKAHLAFKRSLAPTGDIAEETAAMERLLAGGRPSTASLEPRAYYLIPVDHMQELRRFIQAGFEELRILIAQTKQGR